MVTMLLHIRDWTIVNWLGLAGFLLSVVNFSVALFDRIIRIDAKFYFDLQDGGTLALFNHSNRQVIVSHFEIYQAETAVGERIKEADLGWPDAPSDIVIPANNVHKITFTEQYSINGIFFFGENTWIKIFLSNKKIRYIKLYAKQAEGEGGDFPTNF